jgi:hypothetical protein
MLIVLFLQILGENLAFYRYGNFNAGNCNADGTVFQNLVFTSPMPSPSPLGVCFNMILVKRVLQGLVEAMGGLNLQ